MRNHFSEGRWDRWEEFLIANNIVTVISSRGLIIQNTAFNTVFVTVCSLYYTINRDSV